MLAPLAAAAAAAADELVAVGNPWKYCLAPSSTLVKVTSMSRECPPAPQWTAKKPRRQTIRQSTYQTLNKLDLNLIIGARMWFDTLHSK